MGNGGVVYNDKLSKEHTTLTLFMAGSWLALNQSPQTSNDSFITNYSFCATPSKATPHTEKSQSSPSLPVHRLAFNVPLKR